MAAMTALEGAYSPWTADAVCGCVAAGRGLLPWSWKAVATRSRELVCAMSGRSPERCAGGRRASAEWELRGDSGVWMLADALGWSPT
jgi:hypothetical protein